MGVFGSNPKGTGGMGRHSLLLSSPRLLVLASSAAAIGAPCHPFAVAISFALLVFSEITPKVIGAAHADRIAPLVAYVLTPMLRGLTPVIWFVNLFVQALLKLMRIKPAPDSDTQLTQEELRSLVLEG